MTDDARANLLRLESERVGYFHSEGLDARRVEVRFDDAAPAPDSMDAAIGTADLIVDGILGTGLSGPVREPFAGILGRMNAAHEAGATVVALDAPSGLDCNTGQPLGCAIRAELTLTFGAEKYGFTRPGAEE